METRVNMVVSNRILELLKKYPLLHIENETEVCVKLSGIINVHRSIEGYVLNKNYNIEVYISREESVLPYAIDKGKAVNPKYPHIYKDGRLCLATDVDMRIALKENPSLAKWMYDFVEPYFVSYEYYDRYGIFPIGDRPHGAKGIVQSYMDIFNVEDEPALKIMLFMAYNRYRGHQPCPCGSGERIRKCHGEMMLKFYNDPILLEQVRQDCEMIIQELKKNNNQIGM